MDTKTLKTAPKISVKIWLPVLKKLEQRLDEACLRRDAYLNKLLENEVPLLDSEVSMRNSAEAQAYVATCLDKLPRKAVSLALRPDLVGRLNEVCRNKRIVRDAFFNRLLLLLAASPIQIDRLFFGGDSCQWKQQIWRAYASDIDYWQGDFYPLPQNCTPFWAIRDALAPDEEAADLEKYCDPESGCTIQIQRDITGGIQPIDSVYSRVLENFTDVDLTGFNCHVPDWKIPGNQAELDRQNQLDAAF